MSDARLMFKVVVVFLWAAVFASKSFANAVDTLSPGQWYMAPNTNVSVLDPCPTRDCSYTGTDGQVDAVGAWNGATYDTKRDRLIVWGGGHANYGGNELYVFDVNALAWTRLTNPTVVTSADIAPSNTTNYYHDGTPSSRHTANSLTYAENVDQFFSMAVGSTYGNPGNMGLNVDSYNFTSNAWKTDWQKSPGNLYGTNSTIAAYHPGTGKIWFHATMNSPLAVFDPAAAGGVGAWTSYGSQYLEIYATPIIDTKRNRLVTIGGYGGVRQMFVWDLNNPSNDPTTPATSGDAGGKALESAQAPGFIYDAAGDRYVAWNGGTTVYALDPTTWVWSVIPLSPSNTVTPTAPRTEGTFGRMRYVASKNAFVLVNGTTENVYFFKLTSGSTPIPTVTLTTSAASVVSGGSATLTWSSTNATSCSASGGWSGALATSGTQTLNNLTASGTYSLVCAGAGGSASQVVSIAVTGTPAPTLTFTVTPTSVASGGTTSLSWSSTNATSCTASGSWSGTKGTLGLETSSALSSTGTFTLSCSGVGGTVNQSAVVTVAAAPAPTLAFSANPTSVAYNGSSALSWSSTNASSCTASGAWTGTQPTTGSTPLNALTATGTYTLTCTGAGGSAAQSVTITVSGGGISPSAITTVQVSNLSASAQTNGVVTFGHYFKAGDVPTGYTLEAHNSLGVTIPLQVDKKVAYSDGSMRHAVLTAQLPSLAASSSDGLGLYVVPVATTGAAVSLSSLLATSFDATVSLNVGGTVYTASAKSLLGSGTPKTWLSGPLVSEWIVGGPVKTSAGVAHPHLAAYFHVRAYAGAPISRVSVDMIVENNWTFVASPTAFTYDATLTVGGTTVFTQTGLTHHTHARWHQRAWWGGDPQLYAKLNINYLQDSKAIPKYETLTPTNAFLSGVRQSTPPMTPGDQVDMDQPGAADGVGPLPRWDSVYAVSGDVRAFNYMNANHDGAAAYPAHFRDETTKLPVTIDNYPNADTSNSGGSPAIPLGANPNNTGSFTSHRPSIGYLAYLVTGNYFYLEEMQFWASFDLMWTSAGTRAGASGFGGNGATGIFYDGTLRGTAWMYRNLAQAASITPDTDPLKSYFTSKLNNNLAYHKWQYVDGNSPESNTLGMMYQYGRNDPTSSTYGEYRMWFDAFVSWSFQYVVDLGYSNAAPMRDYKAKTWVGMMGLASNESCFQWVPQYVSHVGPLSSSPIYFSTFKEVYDATAPGASAHVCGSADMASYMSTSLGRTYVLNEMTGGQSDVYYYYSSIQPALAAAADSGIAGGSTVWSRGLLSGVHPDYSNTPNWAIVPRGTTGGTPVPSITLMASPSTIASGASTTLSWSTVNATSCTASGTGFSGSVALNGSQAVSNITATTTYTLSCTGAGGSASQSTVVTVAAAPTVSINATPSSVVSGGSSTLSWTSTNATSCTASGAWSGSQSTSGSSPQSGLTTASTYTLTCVGLGGSAVSSATVTVTIPAPTITITASPASVAYGGSSKLTWSSTNATSCTASGAWNGSQSTNSSQTFSNLTNVGVNTYTLKCDGAGGSVTNSATVTVAAAATPTVTLSASPASVAYNGSSTLTWTSANAVSCAASGAWTGTQALSGSQPLSALTSVGSNVYTLTCYNAVNVSATKSVTITVAAPVTSTAPTLNLGASLTLVDYLGTSTLSWSSTNATSCSASATPVVSGWNGNEPTSGSFTVLGLATKTDFKLSCTGSGGTVAKTVTVGVNPPPVPEVTFQASSTNVVYGGSTTLTWSAKNATTCEATGDWNAKNLAVSGLQVLSNVTKTGTYTMSCTGVGTTSQTITVAVSNAPPDVQFTATYASVPLNGTSTLTWSSTNATSCVASGAWSGDKAMTGSETTAPLQGDSTYTLACTGAGGSTTKSTTITVQVLNNVSDPPAGGSSGTASNATSTKSGGGALDLEALFGLAVFFTVWRVRAAHKQRIASVR